MSRPPCDGLVSLFVPASTRWEELLVEQVAECAAVCAGCCMRRACAEQGVRFNDRSSVRCGLPLWTEEGREQLALIASGKES